MGVHKGKRRDGRTAAAVHLDPPELRARVWALRKAIVLLVPSESLLDPDRRQRRL